MITSFTTDWKRFTTTIIVQGQPYEVSATVFFEIKSEPGQYARGPEQTIEASLDGWHALPEPLPEHLAELEQKLLAEVEERKYDL